MTESQAIEAVYENGIFRPVHPVAGLVEHSKVTLAIEYETQAVHPLAKFAGILCNEEAEEVQTIVAEEFSKLDVVSPIAPTVDWIEPCQTCAHQPLNDRYSGSSPLARKQP